MPTQWSPTNEAPLTTYSEAGWLRFAELSEDGKAPYSPTYIQNNFKKAAKLAKLPAGISFRDFRHMAAQNMERVGIPNSVIARALGTSVRLLESTYLKKTTKSDRELILEKMSKAV